MMAPVLDFATLPPRRKPNRWLLCPPGFTPVPADAPAPEFAVPVTSVQEAWQATIAAEPRIETVTADAAAGRYHHVQRSALFGFADDILVQLIALGATRSSIAILSQARLGYSDFGVNRRRVERLLAGLQRRLRGQSAVSGNSDQS